MGVTLSTPNFIPREDQLLFPNEILLRIVPNLGTRDLLWAKGVCRSWLNFITENDFLSDDFGVTCSGSELVLHELAFHHDQLEEAGTPVPASIAALFLENVELTRNPLSLRFWNLYGDIITRLELTDCAVLPRTSITSESVDGRVVNIETNFHLGCPNLRRLALRKMDKCFMMGAQFLQFHQILNLDNLVSLDVSCNKNLTDRILFDILLKTDRLESLNLSQCPLVLAAAVHKRFYPRGADLADSVEFSDHILSFETIVNCFLRKEKGRYVRELLLKATPLTADTLDLIKDPTVFTWTSLNLSYCRELKRNRLISVLQGHSESFKKFVFKSDGRGIQPSDILSQVTFPNLEHLGIRHCCFSHSSLRSLRGLAKLTTLSCMNAYRDETVTDEVLFYDQLQHDIFSQMRNVTSLNVADSPRLVDDRFIRAVIRTMKGLKRLNVSGCSKLTDFGMTGTECMSNRNLEESDSCIISVLPLWLIRGDVGSKRSEDMEAMLTSLINRGKFPRVLEPRTYLSEDAACLSELKYLEDLNLSSCPLLSSATWHLALRLPHLFKLTLVNNSNISLNSMAVICKNCPSLEYLILVRSNPLFTMDAFREYAKSTLKRLRQFIL